MEFVYTFLDSITVKAYIWGCLYLCALTCLFIVGNIVMNKYIDAQKKGHSSRRDYMFAFGLSVVFCVFLFVAPGVRDVPINPIINVLSTLLHKDLDRRPLDFALRDGAFFTMLTIGLLGMLSFFYQKTKEKIHLWVTIIVIGAGVLVGCGVMVAGGFRVILIQKVVPSFEVNSPDLETKILIAMQGTYFKKELASGIIEKLQGKPVYIQVIDVTELPRIKEEEWQAVVIISTMQWGKLQAETLAYLQQAAALEKHVVALTSGRGNRKPDNVKLDSISSASKIANVAPLVTQIVTQVETILEPES